MSRILLAHGGGGRLTRDLILREIVPFLGNPYLAPLSDSAVLPQPSAGKMALTTDAFVVDPPVFPGGDVGYLAVCGTINDLAVSGARPLFLTWALIMEEGLEEELLRLIVEGARRGAKEAGVEIVAGDTKVVPKGKGDKIFICTTGLGVIPTEVELSDNKVEEGDAIVVSGPIGDHGATIMACRHGLTGSISSDVAPVWPLVERLLASGVGVHAMHDPTRGGVATVCWEVAERTGLRVSIEEALVPVRPSTEAVCELLGLDPLYMACEGRLLAWVERRCVEDALDALRSHPLGREAKVIGTMQRRPPGGARVVLRTLCGSERPLDLLSGLDLPRIC